MNVCGIFGFGDNVIGECGVEDKGNRFLSHAKSEEIIETEDN